MDVGTHCQWALTASGHSLPARVGLHLASKDLVHVGLIPLSAAAKPREYIRVDSETDKLLDRPVKTTDVNLRWGRLSFRRVRKINLRVGLTREPLEFPTLLVTEGSRKERVRWNSPFLPR
jgi:hypothetical protein